MLSTIASRFAFDADDTSSVRSEKNTIFLIALSCSIAGFVWGLAYAAILGNELATVFPFVFTAVVGSSLVISHVTKNHLYAVYAETASIIVFTGLIQWSIGGLFDSGIVMVWAAIGPLGALLFFYSKEGDAFLRPLLLCVGNHSRVR